ncbi:unnamed protein product [Darwinula stevensoni]|uniref:Uncharacterized protein n=1 Tax=Darwinula stevensoni TaxID=69355 RepID=A0A7R8XBY7_9CRUS|nr:unnamed protein product [Darwinula stevensoni]CAG0893258.1 unnamed protein product [Darwinula stevensoni]
MKIPSLTNGLRSSLNIPGIPNEACNWLTCCLAGSVAGPCCLFNGHPSCCDCYGYLRGFR